MRLAANKRFVRPVIIQIGRASRERVVTDVGDAARLLLRDWQRESKKRQAAMEACLRVLRGEARSPFARQAFVAAAIKAKVLRATQRGSMLMIR